MIRAIFFVAYVCLASSAWSSPLDRTWHMFQTRCLVPFENFEPAQTEGLIPIIGETGAFALATGAVLRVNEAPEDGRRDCSVSGAGLAKGFESWRRQVEATGQYREIQNGIWHSHEWIEPVIAIHRTNQSVRVVETRLES